MEKTSCKFSESSTFALDPTTKNKESDNKGSELGSAKMAADLLRVGFLV